MNPQSNPFQSMIQQMQAAKTQGQNPGMGGQHPMLQQAIQSSAPQNPAAAMPPGMQGAGGAKAPVIENSLTPGQNPGSTDSLIKALSALNSVITDSDDPQEVQMVRQLIVMIQQLIQRDQHKQGSKDSALGQAQQGAAQAPQSLQAPGGLGAGSSQ